MKNGKSKVKMRLKELFLASVILTSALILRRTAVSAEGIVSLFKARLIRNEDGTFQPDFPEEIEKNGRTYVLSEVILNEIVPEPKTYEPEEVTVSQEETFVPEERVTVAGCTYVLQSVEDSTRIISGRVQETEAVRYHNDTEVQELSKLEGTLMHVSVTDPETGKSEEGDIAYGHSEEESTFWLDDLNVRLVFTESDADYFLLKDVLYENNEEIPLPESAYPDILKDLRLDPAENRIRSIVWNSGPYEAEGTLCKDAAVLGQTLHRRYRDHYEGEVALPDLKYVTYRLLYVESEEDLFRRTEADAEAVYVLKD